MAGAAKPSLAIVVKYFPPTPRISGIIGYLAALTKHLGDRFDVEVITYGTAWTTTVHLRTEHGRVTQVGAPFPVRAGRIVRSRDTDAVLVVSGLHEPWLFVPYWGLFELAAGTGEDRHLYQVTLPERPPPRPFARVLHRYRSVLCASDEIAERLAPLTSRPLTVLPPGVDVEQLRSVEPAARRDGFRIGFLNHLNRIKGFDRALAIFREWAADHPGAELVVAGTGELEDEARSAADRDARVTLHGYLDEGTRLALIASCDVMLLPFRTGVSVLGLSQTVLECLALGTVVVGSATPSIAPAIADGDDGLLFDSDEQAREHLTALVGDPARLEAMAEAARESAVRFDVRARAETITDLLGV